MTDTSVAPLTKKDFVSDQDVRWCPGCGDYSILAQTQKTMPDLGIPKEKIVFVAGIGCSSRFPYYMDTFGFHTIHGRAPAIASGVKVSNPPFGSLDRPFNPISLALGANSTFVSRTIDTNTLHLQESLKRAHLNKGTSFIEVYQNCLIYNDGAFSHLSDKSVKDDNILDLKHKEPMIFGKERDKGIRLDGFKAEAVKMKKNISKEDLLVHDEHDRDLAGLLSNFTELPSCLCIEYFVLTTTAF